MKLIIIFFVVFTVLSSSAFKRPCGTYFQFELDDSNRVKSGILTLNVTSNILKAGFMLDALFGTKDLPVQVILIFFFK